MKILLMKRVNFVDLHSKNHVLRACCTCAILKVKKTIIYRYQFPCKISA